MFPNTPANLRSDTAGEALNPDNLICRAIKAIKDAVPEIGVLTDVALDPYTSHGHDGLTDARGCIVNDDTVKVLVEQALVQCGAGADIVAPSDMMDGRVGAIRAALEDAGHCDTAIMAYAAKYASAFYGPFREAVGSLGRLKGDKRRIIFLQAERAVLVGVHLPEGCFTIPKEDGLARRKGLGLGGLDFAAVHEAVLVGIDGDEGIVDLLHVGRASDRLGAGSGDGRILGGCRNGGGRQERGQQ